MESLMTPSISKPPIPIPYKQDLAAAEFSPKPTNSCVSFPRKTHSNITDARLNYLCEKGCLSEAVVALDSIAQNEVRSETFVNLLQYCIESNSVILGRKIHAKINLMNDKNPFVETKLVGMYAKCGSLSDARKVFDEMRDRNLYTWSAMIGACAREHRWKEVVELFYMMMADNVFPDGFLMPKILQACGNSGDFRTGTLIHSLAVKCGISNPRVNNSILAVYAKCGKLSLARRLFESMDTSDTVAWNAIISGYCRNGDIKEAHGFFDAMCKEGIEPNSVTWSTLITGYNQIGYCDIAMELLKKMKSFGINPDVFSWTSIVSGFAQNYRENEALDLFREMILAGVEPNGITIASAISACATLKALNKGLEIHSLAVKMGFADGVLVGNSLIDMYAKCGDLEAAQQVFDMMLERDIYTWNSLIGGYCQAGYCGKAHVLLMTMQNSDIQPDVITWNTMISGYIQSGDEDESIDLFHRMEKDGKIKRDAASWNCLVDGYLQIGQKDKAFGIFRQMQFSNVKYNHITILNILPACANLLASKKVKEIHGCVLRRNLESVLSITNSFIDTYAKSGNIRYSRAIFDRMLYKDLITFNSLIRGYVLHGCSDAALDVIDQMKKLGLKPSEGTFVNIILAHSLAGMVDEGKQVFSSMLKDSQIMPTLQHYSAMIDLYGRSGRLDEAVEFIDDMPIKPDLSVWFALLTACRIHGNVGLAIRARESLLNLEPGNSLICPSVCGNQEYASRLRRFEKDNKVLKPVGQSWIEVKNMVHSFVPGELSKASSDLFSWVESISRKVKAHYPLGGFCIEEEEEEEKEEITGVHSEKLALAFAFVYSPSAPQSIRIVKNLRMCGDCHRMAKYISMKYGCEIYLNDSKCFHHFKSGRCSCGEYW